MTAGDLVKSSVQPFPDGGWSWHGGSGAVIWQLMFTGSGLLTGLKRFREQRRAALFCLDPETGCALCDDVVLAGGGKAIEPVGEGWMIGLETTHRNLLYCHAFQPGGPEHQGIWALDPSSGTLVWSRPDLAFAANLGDTFLAYSSRVFAGFPERDYFLIDPLTGSVIEQIGTAPERFNPLRNAALAEDERQGVVLPVAGIGEPAGHLERIDCGASTVTARHSLMAGDEGTDSSWQSVLSVVVGSRIVYEDMMGKAGIAPLFNNFLVRDRRLFYIKEREVLISFAVS